MYILFINLGGKCDIYIFFAQFNDSNKKICSTHGFNPTQPDPCGLGWVEFFFDPPWWVGSKNHLNSTQPDPCTPLSYTIGHRGDAWERFGNTGGACWRA